MIRLLQGDCLELLPTISAASVDLVLCDLPYGITACKWDAVIPLAPLWAQYNRICKGAVVLTAAQPFTSALVMSNIAEFKYQWVWDKVNRNTGYGNVSFMPLRRHEDILIFLNRKGKPTYNPQMTEGEPYTAKRSGKTPGVYRGGGLIPQNGVYSGVRFPVSILPIKAVERKEMGLHPTQKPVALMEYLIRTYTNPGDTVLDNCMGSGTTGVACVDTDRNFIGMERDPNYFKIAERRINDAIFGKMLDATNP